ASSRAARRPAVLRALPGAAQLTGARLERAAEGAGPDGTGWRLVLQGRGEEVAADLGPGWTSTGALAVSWAPAGDDALRADVVFVETPHRLLLQLDPAGGTVRATWVTEPLHDVPLGELRAPGAP
ncbi:serine hydrolase, partial [Kineococcus sp. T90]|nr:serine hydrolase [Kineococcus indalonis]